jgi:hypothetical protein
MSTNNKYALAEDEHGNPLLLAVSDVKRPGQVAAQRVSGAIATRATRGGNPQFDPASGRFTGPGTSEQKPEETRTLERGTRVPAGVDPDQWERRLDRVRDVARQFPDLADVTGISEFLAGAVADVNEIDLDAFLADAREQRIDDLSDILNHQLAKDAKDVSLPRGVVRLEMSQTFQQRAMAGLNDQEVARLVTRLAGRGWDNSDIQSHILTRIQNEERKEQLEQLFGTPKKRGKSGEKK